MERARALGSGASAVTVDDEKNGRYVIRFTQAAAGECKVMVRLDNQDVPPMMLQFKGDKEDKGKTSSVEDLISRSRMVVEEASDLEEIRTALQNELNQSVERRVEGVRVRIKSRKEEMQQRLEAAEVGLEFKTTLKF